MSPKVSPGSGRSLITSVRQSRRSKTHPAAFDLSSQSLTSDNPGRESTPPPPSKTQLSGGSLGSQPIMFADWKNRLTASSSGHDPLIDASPEEDYFTANDLRVATYSGGRLTGELKLLADCRCESVQSPSPTLSVLLRDQRLFNQELLSTPADPTVNVPRSLVKSARNAVAINYTVGKDGSSSRGNDSDDDSMDCTDYSAYYTPKNSQKSRKALEDTSPSPVFLSLPVSSTLPPVDVLLQEAMDISHHESLTVTGEPIDDALLRAGAVGRSEEIVDLELVCDQTDRQDPAAAAEKDDMDIQWGDLDWSPKDQNMPPKGPSIRAKSMDFDDGVPSEWPFQARLDALPRPDNNSGVRFQLPTLPPLFPPYRRATTNHPELPAPVVRKTRGKQSDNALAPASPGEAVPNARIKDRKGFKWKQTKRGKKWQKFEFMKNRLDVGNNLSFDLWQQSAIEPDEVATPAVDGTPGVSQDVFVTCPLMGSQEGTASHKEVNPAPYSGDSLPGDLERTSSAHARRSLFCRGSVDLETGSDKSTPPFLVENSPVDPLTTHHDCPPLLASDNVMVIGMSANPGANCLLDIKKKEMESQVREWAEQDPKLQLGSILNLLRMCDSDEE